MNIQKFSKVKNIALNDIRIILCDKSLLVMAVVPFIIYGLLFFGLPQLVREIEILMDYQTLIMTVLLVVISLFPAFILSFIVMDEKELSLNQVFNILPRNYIYLLSLRIVMSFLYGFFIALLVMFTLPGITLHPLHIIIHAMLIAFCGTQVFLIIVTWAKQKVEAMTWMKGLNFVFMLPAVTVFVPFPFTKILAILPTYWLFNTYHTGLDGFPVDYIIALVQSITYLVLLKILAKRKLGFKMETAN